MRQLAAATAMALAVAAGAGVRAQEVQPPDPVTQMLAALEVGLAAPDRGELAAALALTPQVRDWLATRIPPGDGTFISIVERARSAAHVLAEVFIAQGARGALATWNITLVPAPTSSGLRVIEIVEISRYADLVRLELPDDRAYHVVDLVVTGPDFTLTVPSGTMFTSLVEDQPTAVVLLGQAHVRFAPRDPAEQGQIRIFSGSPALETSIDAAFIRINPIDAGDAIRWRERRTIPVAPAVLDEARATLEARAPLSFQIDPAEDAPGMWSVAPDVDSRLVDFRSAEYGWLTYSRSPDELEDVALFDRTGRKQISLYSYEPSLGTLLAGSALEVANVDLDLTFDPARLWFSGVARLSLDLTYRMSSITLRLDAALTVERVWSPDAGHLLTVRPAGEDTVTIALPTDFSDGPLTLEIQYHGQVEPQRLSSDRIDDSRPTFPVDDFPWPIESRYLYTLGRWWYPFASGGIRGATVRLTVPEGYRALANGQLVETVVTDAAPGRWSSAPGRVTSFEYRTDRPVPYLSTLVARTDALGTARATVPIAAPATGPSASVDVATFAGQSRSTRLRNTPERVRAILEFYGSVLGGAPYPSLTVVTLEDLMPGGHSPAYFSLVNVPHAATPLIWSRDPAAFEDAPDFFLAHEIAHQWWGQAVAARTYRDQWISEGFAQYMAWLYETASRGDEIGRRLMSRMRSTGEGLAAEGPIQLGARLGHLRDDRRIFRSLVYNKSAVVLHMLRRLIGDDAFFAGLRRLYAEHRYERATTSQVRMAFETDVDMPLGRYFDRWIYGATVPRLRFTWTRTGTDRITIGVEQLGETFDVPYDVTIEYVDGTRERHLLKIDEASETFEIATRTAVRRVLFEDDLTLAEVVVQ